MDSVLEEFFSWLTVHRLGREHLFHQMREKYDWGYIKACEVIEAELRRLIEEHEDGTDRLAGDQGLLDDQVPECGDNVIPAAR